jgi:DNA polymerase III alpha subunit (gram-positive type)
MFKYFLFFILYIMIQTNLVYKNFSLQKRLCVLDIETTGKHYSNSLVVEIGICELDIETGKITKLFDKIVKENGIAAVDKNSWIFLHSNLKYDDVCLSGYIEQYRNEIQDILDNYCVTAFNKSFDFSFLRNRKFIIKNETYCPMVLLTPIMKLPLYGRYKFPKVEEAWNYLFPSIEYVEKHRAYDDAYHESQIVYEMIKRGWFKINF